jgi:FkbM family methyltransferase
LRLDPLVAAAYAEIQGRFGIKPDLRRTLNTLLRRPVEADFNIFRSYVNLEGHVYVDAGAHRGRTIESVRLFRAELPIVAFEPNPVRVAGLQALFARDQNVKIEPYGLADTSGVADLFVPHYKGAAFDGFSSLHRNEAEYSLSRKNVWGFDRNHFEVRQFRCAVRKLDDFALRVGFLKIDVQGAEAAVLAGGRETIRMWKPIVLMENNRPETDGALLFELGYEPYAFVGDRLIRGQLGCLNTIYIHPERRSTLISNIYAV